MQTDTISHPPIFKRDTSGRIRIWRMEQQGCAHRVLSGLRDGAQAATGWTACEGKQGRNDVQQADFEIASAYTYHLKREYFENVEDVDSPRFFKPMLAGKYDGFAPGFAQPKLDGIRCLARQSGLYTREGQPILGAPHVHADMAGLFQRNPDLILDGELYNHELKDDFNSIVSLVRRKEPDAEHIARSRDLVQYHVYDLPSSAGVFGQRLDQLTDAVAVCSRDVVQLVETHAVDEPDHYDVLHGNWLEAGYEGSMWRADAQYEQKRSKTLLKRKEFQDAEYECVEIVEGTGNWAGLAKSVMCRLPDGRTFGAGIKGSQQRAAELLSETHRVVTVQFFHLTPDGIPRFPVVTKFWGEAREL
jgi:DNA ligase-1